MAPVGTKWEQKQEFDSVKQFFKTYNVNTERGE